MLKTSLIIGNGEIGSSLAEVLGKKYPVWIFDRRLHKIVSRGTMPDSFDVMHVCIPPIPNYKQVIQFYKDQYKPRFTVIHSSFPIGTARELGAFVSPVRGVHPNIAKGIRTFVKYLAPKDAELTAYFRRAGIKIREVERPEDVEAIKLWDTTYYGWNIIFEKILHDWCQKHGISPEIVYRDANETYNEGYTKLGRKEVVRPILRHMEGDIGGHCVMQNLALFDSPIGDFIKKYNATFKMPQRRKSPRKRRS